MRCKTCQKKITFEHYYGSTGSGPGGGKIRLVLKCQCGFTTIPFDVVQISRGRGLLSSGKVRHRKNNGDASSNGKRLSKEGQKIFDQQGEQAYTRWTREVFLPMMDARLKKLRAALAK